MYLSIYPFTACFYISLCLKWIFFIIRHWTSGLCKLFDGKLFGGERGVVHVMSQTEGADTKGMDCLAGAPVLGMCLAHKFKNWWEFWEFGETINRRGDILPFALRVIRTKTLRCPNQSGSGWSVLDLGTSPQWWTLTLRAACNIFRRLGISEHCWGLWVASVGTIHSSIIWTVHIPLEECRDARLVMSAVQCVHTLANKPMGSVRLKVHPLPRGKVSAVHKSRSSIPSLMCWSRSLSGSEFCCLYSGLVCSAVPAVSASPFFFLQIS